MHKLASFQRLTFLLLLLSITGCTSVPDGISPVNDFELERYLGTWYEIARLDHSFERELQQVSATYTLNSDGSVKVLNRGFNADSGWEDAEGKAKFVEDKNTGHLKVSFFGPFYASYVIFELDKQEYQYAFITGYNREYLWLLSRTPEITPELENHFLKSIEELGFDTEQLIWVEQ